MDQIFIGQGVGYLGNAATNVAYPFSTICLAIALLVGIGSASRVSLCLGRKEPEAAAKAAGNGIVLMGIFGIIYLLLGEALLPLLLKAFGATTDVFPYAKPNVFELKEQDQTYNLTECQPTIPKQR